MKLLYKIVFYVCFVQICFGRKNNENDGEMSDFLEIQKYVNGTDAIKDVSPQFVKDVYTIFEKFQDNVYVIKQLKDMMRMYAIYLDAKDSRINGTAIKKISERNQNAKLIDNVYILKAILSKQLPAKTVNGFINLLLILRRGATDEEIENTLGYLYDKNEPMAIIDNVLPYTTQEQCLSESVSGTTGIVLWQDLDSFKTYFENNTKISTRVVEDVTIIAEKISCNAIVSKYLTWMMNYLVKFDKADVTESTVCQIKGDSLSSLIFQNEEKTKINFITIETLVSTRIPERDFTDFLAYLRYLFSETTTAEENKTVIEYVYGPDLSKTIGGNQECQQQNI